MFQPTPVLVTFFEFTKLFLSPKVCVLHVNHSAFCCCLSKELCHQYPTTEFSWIRGGTVGMLSIPQGHLEGVRGHVRQQCLRVSENPSPLEEPTACTGWKSISHPRYCELSRLRRIKVRAYSTARLFLRQDGLVFEGSSATHSK